MKNKIKKLLLDLDVFYYLKYSAFFKLYQVLSKKDQIKTEKHELQFYSSFLPKCNLVFDIGAYDGHKTEVFRKIAKKIVCCEPDKDNFRLLKIRFRNQTKSILLENKGVGSQAGLVEYYINDKGSAFNTLSLKFKEMAENKGRNKWLEDVRFPQTGSTEVITLDQLIEKYGQPDFIKIDTEGYEAEVIKGLSHKVPYLSFECVYPEFKDELLQILDRLKTIWDNHVTYNLSFEEELLLPSFTTENNLLKIVEAKQLPYFEVIAFCTSVDNTVGK